MTKHWPVAKHPPATRWYTFGTGSEQLTPEDWQWLEQHRRAKAAEAAPRNVDWLTEREPATTEPDLT